MADVNLAAAQEVAAQFHVPVATADYRQLLAAPDIQAAAICTATDTHAEIIQAAAAQGKHIFCGKPIDLDLQRIQHALDAVSQAGVKLQVGFNRRFDLSFAKARELVAAGKIGAPTRCGSPVAIPRRPHRRCESVRWHFSGSDHSRLRHVMAVVLGLAAKKSLPENRPVKVSEIY